MNPLALNPWFLGGIAAVILAACTFGGCEHMNASNARAAEKVATANFATAQNANGTNQVTIKSQARTIADLLKLVTPSQAMKDAAAKAAMLEQENDRLNAALAKRAEKDYAKPDCVKLLDTDFELVCPNIAAGLRERASRYEHRAGRDPEAGGGEDRPHAD